MKKDNKGFSLVELIIVIAIMAVLVGVLAPQFIKYVEQSRRSRDIATANEIREAILADIADNQITASNGSFTPVAGNPTNLAETPTAAATAANGAGFTASFDVTAGTCEVQVSGGTLWLTQAADASTYKTASGI